MTFRILSLDGGGTWALLEALALADLYPDQDGRSVLSHFDLVVASSGGSIVLGGLMIGMTPREIVETFHSARSRNAIFRRKRWPGRLLSRIPIFPRYVAAEKRHGLGALLKGRGDVALGAWPRQDGWPKGPGGKPVRVLIMAFDYDRRRGDYLRSYEIPRTGAQPEPMPLVDAIHASSNAPVSFFDAPAQVKTPESIHHHKRYWDGAMGGHNNPLLAGVVDALALGAPPRSIRALTIGTGTVRLAPPDAADPEKTPRQLIVRKAVPGPIGDAGRAAACITNDPPDSATYIAHVVLGNHPAKVGRVVRLCPVVQPISHGAGRWDYPDGLEPSAFDTLASLSIDAIEPDEVEVIQKLGDAWIDDRVPNQPIRMSDDDLSCLLGHDTYSKAKAAWRALA